MRNVGSPERGVLWNDPAHCDLQVVSGQYHPDGWMSRACEFHVRTRKNLETLRLDLWNPDFAKRYIGNCISVSLRGEEFVAAHLYPGESLSFVFPFPGQEERSFRLRIGSEAFCKPGGLDRRERGVILTSGVLVFRD